MLKSLFRLLAEDEANYGILRGFRYPLTMITQTETVPDHGISLTRPSEMMLLEILSESTSPNTC